MWIFFFKKKKGGGVIFFSDSQSGGKSCGNDAGIGTESERGSSSSGIKVMERSLSDK